MENLKKYIKVLENLIDNLQGYKKRRFILHLKQRKKELEELEKEYKITHKNITDTILKINN